MAEIICSEEGGSTSKSRLAPRTNWITIWIEGKKEEKLEVEKDLLPACSMSMRPLALREIRLHFFGKVKSYKA